MTVLEVKNAAFQYKSSRTVFSDVSFSLNKGQILSIIGPNGCGKTTLLNCLGNLLKVTGGEILLFGKSLNEYRPKEIARIVGYVPQILTLSFGYSVRDFVVMGRAPHISILATPREGDFALADQAIADMRITHLADRPYTEISGGERQQATIARVVVQKPQIIMMDEPTSALDFGNQMLTVKMIRSLADQGYTVIMTTHTPDHAIMLDDTVAIMDREGRLRIGGAMQIMREDILQEVYRTKLKLVYVPEVGRMTCVSSNY